MSGEAPAEMTAEARLALDAAVQRWRCSVPGRAVLFVGGPMHGEIRALDGDPAAIPAVEPDGLRAVLDEQVQVVRWGEYRPIQWASRVDGGVYDVVQLWLWENRGLVTPAEEVGVQVADAAIRALVGHSFLSAERGGARDA